MTMLFFLYRIIIFKRSHCYVLIFNEEKRKKNKSEWESYFGPFTIALVHLFDLNIKVTISHKTGMACCLKLATHKLKFKLKQIKYANR